MDSNRLKQAAIIFLGLFLSACATTPEHGSAENGALANGAACHVIYDAGSSRTRLYIYQHTATGWVQHSGPKRAALADPVRRNRGKTMADAGTVTDSIVAALDDIRRDGPLKKDGSRRWQAFDWQSQCRLNTVAVYATAGMRLAEQNNPAEAELLWDMLNRKLSDALGMAVTTRTLTGFEEGLFAWLAAREEQGDGNFGVAEMGGASAQISFPCATCETSRQVLVQGVDVPLVSFSFLGMGQDEAWKKHSRHAACKWGVGLKNPHWRAADCTDGIEIPASTGQAVRELVDQADVRRWYLAGAFGYRKYSDIDNYCRNDIDSGFKPKSSCFRALYQSYFLNSLGVPVSSELSDVDWTLGAAICTASSCLAKAGPPECQWSARGCVD